MSRVAEGTLQITVKDSQLDAHITKLRAVKEAWQDMSQGAAALKNLVPAEVATELTALNNAVTGNTTQLKTFTGVMQSLGSTMAGLPKQLRDFAAAVDRIRYGASGAAAGMREFAKHVTSMATTLGKHGIDKKLDAFSKSAGESAKKARSMGRGFHVAADGLADLNDEFERAKTQGLNVNVGIPAQQAVDGVKRAAREASSGIKKMQQDFIRFGATAFIVYHWFKGLSDEIKDATQAVDLRSTLNLSLKDFTQTMEAAREATRGTVNELEMMKSAALMSSFGLPMDKFAEQMGMVQKMAIRTGQSTEYLMESLARGVSRLSPMILDNLGLQISLSKSYEKYAASVGKSASALTEFEKKQAVMNEVMRQSAELTKNVEVGASVSAQFAAVKAAMEDAMRSVAETAVKLMVRGLQRADLAAAELVQTVKLLKKEMKDTGSNTAQMTMLDFISLTRSGEMSGAQKLVLGWLDIVRDIAGWKKEMITLDEEQIRNLERGADMDKKRLEVSKKLYLQMKENEAVGNTRSIFGGLTTEAAVARAALDMRYQALMVEQKALEAAYERGQVDEASYRLNSRANADKIEAMRIQYDLEYRGTKQAILLDKLAANKDRIKGQEALIKSNKEVTDEMLKQLELQAFQLMAEKALADQRKATERGGTDLLSDKEAQSKLLVDDVHLRKAAYAVALLQLHVSRAMKAEELGKLRMLDEQIVQNQLAAEGQLSIEYKHEQAKKTLNELMNEYVKLQENSIEHGKGDLNATVEQIRKAGEEVKAQQAKVAALKEQAKYQKMGLDAAHDVNLLSKKERDHLAFVLAGNMTRAQVEAEFLKMRADVVKHEEAVAKLLEVQAALRIAGLTAFTGMLEVQLSAQKKVLEQSSEQLGRWAEKLKRFTMPSTGGGRARAEKETKERIEDMVYRIADSSFRQEKEMNEAGRTVSRVFFDGVRQEWTLRWDEEKKMWSSDLSRDFREILQGAYDTTAPMQWSALGTFTTRPREALDEIKRMTTDIQAFRDKMQQENALTFQEDAYLDTLLSRLEGERLVMEERISLLDQWSDHANSAAEAMRNAFSFAGDAQFFGREINNIIDNATETFERYAEVLKQSEYSTYDLFSASMPMMRATYQAFVKSKRQQAGIEMVMQAAAAWAAYPDVPKMVAHGTASLLYGAIAGGAIKLPSRTQSSAAKKEEAPVSKGPFHVHLYGDSIATEGERGRYLEQIMAEARAEGRI